MNEDHVREAPKASVRLEPGRLLFAGELRSTHGHAHAAVQVLFVTTGRVTLIDEHGGATPVRKAIIPTGVPHVMEAHDAFGVIAYLDPAARLSRALDALVDAQATLAQSDRRTSRIWSDSAEFAMPTPSAGCMDLEAVEHAMLLAGTGMPHIGNPMPPLSRPVQHALALLPELVNGPVRLHDVAAAACLSPSRLRHLFIDELGLTFTSCVRWVRLKAAMQAVQRGNTLTQAAHAAGFADSAHLTRVFRAMFGMTPSAAVRDLCWH